LTGGVRGGWQPLEISKSPPSKLAPMLCNPNAVKIGRIPPVHRDLPASPGRALGRFLRASAGLWLSPHRGQGANLQVLSTLEIPPLLSLSRRVPLVAGPAVRSHSEKTLENSYKHFIARSGTKKQSQSWLIGDCFGLRPRNDNLPPVSPSQTDITFGNRCS
jgi:hypothetical protein